MRHMVVHRTSPKGPGQPFLGTCGACGKKEITFEQLGIDDCENVRGMTNEEAFLEAIDPT